MMKDPQKEEKYFEHGAIGWPEFGDPDEKSVFILWMDCKRNFRIEKKTDGLPAKMRNNLTLEIIVAFAFKGSSNVNISGDFFKKVRSNKAHKTLFNMIGSDEFKFTQEEK